MARYKRPGRIPPCELGPPPKNAIYTLNIPQRYVEIELSQLPDHLLVKRQMTERLTKLDDLVRSGGIVVFEGSEFCGRDAAAFVLAKALRMQRLHGWCVDANDIETELGSMSGDLDYEKFLDLQFLMIYGLIPTGLSAYGLKILKREIMRFTNMCYILIFTTDCWRTWTAKKCLQKETDTIEYLTNNGSGYFVDCRLDTERFPEARPKTHGWLPPGHSNIAPIHKRRPLA